MNQLSPMSAFLTADELRPPSDKLRVRLVDAGAFTCKYILGEADEHAMCCGAPTSGKSWCDYHRRIVFEPPRSRTR
jgi:hypothetical protein